MNIYIIALILIKIGIINAITLYVQSFFYDEASDTIFKEIIEKYQKYNAERNIEIKIELNHMNENNATLTLEDYNNVIFSLCSKKTTKYDIYLYYDFDIQAITSHLVNIKDYVDDDFINRFPPELINNSKTADGRVVGIPYSMTIDSFYSNKLLLAKYDKEIPKTWDQMIETAKEILTKEKDLNNTSLIGYNGLLTDDENGVLSVQEFFRSYRESNYHPNIALNSNEAKEALKMIKRIKEEISSDEAFLSDIGQTIQRLFNGQAIFLKFYYIGPVPFYTASSIPGKNENVSGSSASASNLLVNRYISKERQEAAVDFIKFVTSTEIQKEYVLKGSMISPVNELYYDEEICKLVDCLVPLRAQPYSWEVNEELYYDKTVYANKLKQYAYDYIYRDEDIDVVFKKMNDLSKLYHISIGTEDSIAGLLVFIITLVIIFIMCLFIIIILIKNKNNSISGIFLPTDLWIFSLMGSMIMLCAIFSIYGELTVTKCFMKSIIFNLGFYINTLPVLIQLMVNFPEDNKVTMWLNKPRNKYLFIFIILFIQIILMGISTLKPYSVDVVIINDGENYQECVLKSTLSSVLMKTVEIFEIIIQILSLILFFIEWNLLDTHYEIRILFSLSVIDILLLFIYLAFRNVNFNSYIKNNVFLCTLITVFSLSNYIFVFLLKLKFLIKQKSNSMEMIVNEIRKSGNNEKSNNKSSSMVNSSVIKSSERRKSVSQSQTGSGISREKSGLIKILQYHFQEIKSGQDLKDFQDSRSMQDSKNMQFSKNSQ